MSDEFGAPAARPKDAEYDRFGRYLLPDPVTGEVTSYTRATTLAGTLDDRWALEAWKMRMVALGLGKRPDLLALVATAHDPHDTDKSMINDACQRALEAAGGTERRDLGTALHALTHSYDRGDPAVVEPGRVVESLRPGLAAYAAAMRTYGLEVAPDYVERKTVVPGWGVAGTVDRCMVRDTEGKVRVLDIKTGRTLEYSEVYIAIQLAVYQRGLAEVGVFDEQARRWDPLPPGVKLDDAVGYVMHLPGRDPKAGQELEPTLYMVDLTRGRALVELALDVRGKRKTKGLLAPLHQPAASAQQVADRPPVPPADVELVEPVRDVTEAELAQMAYGGRAPDVVVREAEAMLEAIAEIRAAGTLGELSKLWRRYSGAGLWHGAVEQAGIDRGREIEAETARAAEAAAPCSCGPGQYCHRSDCKSIDASALPDVRSLLELVALANSREELSALWQLCQPGGLREGEWTAEVHAAGLARRAQLDDTGAA